jgi:TolB-like protein/class 3 adenylate cyclase
VLTTLERKLAAILAADVAGYSRLMELDEAGTFERLKVRRIELVEPAIAAHRGSIFKLMGDGLLAEFGSVVDAVECAVDIQRGMAELNAGLPDDQRIDVRIGVNLGEVIVEGKDRHGEGVNIAARLEQLADPGGICVSGKVASEVEKKLAFGFEPMGAQRVKNISEPIPVYRVKLDGVKAPAKRKPPRSELGDRATRIAATMVLLAGLAAAGWYGLMRSWPPLVSAHVPAIAVLPFDDMSPDKSLGYFGDGVSEDIITMLSRSPDVVTVARNSSFAYKGKAIDVRQVGRELNVGYVLEGSVRKETDQVRIVAQLIDAKSGEHVWAERFDKTGGDPWALQDEVTSKIIGALTGEKGELKQAQYRDAWGKDRANLAEYDYYLRGHEFFMQITADGIERARRIWEEGLAKFPNSVLLQCDLGWVYYNRAINGWSDDLKDDFGKAGAIVRRSLARQDLSPLERRLCHWLFANVSMTERDFERALAEAETAKRLAPYDAWMNADLSVVLLAAGRPMQAVEELDAAGARDPANAAYYNGLKAWALEIAGRPEESLAASKSGFLYGNMLPLVKAIVFVRLGRSEEARAEVRKALDMEPSSTQAKWREANFYSDPSILERELDDLASAGLPQK